MTPEHIMETVELVRRAEEHVEVVSTYVRNHHIVHEWTTFTVEARAEAGLPAPSHPILARHALASFEYVMDVQADALYFDSTGAASHPHSYSIPIGFLFPETREAVKAEERAHYARLAAETNMRHAAH